MITRATLFVLVETRIRKGCGRLVLALDGPSCAGKSTLAREYAEHLGAEIISMDDFFLPPEMRTPERLAEPGGNIHYERFLAEVAQPLMRGEPVTYGVFSCSEMRITHTRSLSADGLVVVEGVYSHHPAFGDYADMRAVVCIKPEEQRARLEKREPPEKVQTYLERWIPLEERYFEHFGIMEKAYHRVGSK